MADLSAYARAVLDRYVFGGFHGCESWCALEVIPVADSHTAVIATELQDNPGTSITNAFELLAVAVCRDFRIDPSLMWIEHYGYHSAIPSGNPRRFDRVEFEVVNAGARVLIHQPTWRPMTEQDWQEARMPVRPSVWDPMH